MFSLGLVRAFSVVDTPKNWRKESSDRRKGYGHLGTRNEMSFESINRLNSNKLSDLFVVVAVTDQFVGLPAMQLVGFFGSVILAQLSPCT
jgi:hypothetical protein